MPTAPADTTKCSSGLVDLWKNVEKGAADFISGRFDPEDIKFKGARKIETNLEARLAEEYRIHQQRREFEKVFKPGTKENKHAAELIQGLNPSDPSISLTVTQQSVVERFKKMMDTILAEELKAGIKIKRRANYFPIHALMEEKQSTYAGKNLKLSTYDPATQAREYQNTREAEEAGVKLNYNIGEVYERRALSANRAKYGKALADWSWQTTDAAGRRLILPTRIARSDPKYADYIHNVPIPALQRFIPTDAFTEGRLVKFKDGQTLESIALSAAEGEKVKGLTWVDMKTGREIKTNLKDPVDQRLVQEYADLAQKNKGLMLSAVNTVYMTKEQVSAHPAYYQQLKTFYGSEDYGQVRRAYKTIMYNVKALNMAVPSVHFFHMFGRSMATMAQHPIESVKALAAFYKDPVAFKQQYINDGGKYRNSHDVVGKIKDTIDWSDREPTKVSRLNPINMIEAFNRKILWDTTAEGMTMMTYGANLKDNLKRYGKIATPEEIRRMTARVTDQQMGFGLKQWMPGWTKQAVISELPLAPMWIMGNYGMTLGMIGRGPGTAALNNAERKIYTSMIRTHWVAYSLAAYGAYDFMNYMISGHHSWENEPGHKFFELELNERDERGMPRHVTFSPADGIKELLFQANPTLWHRYAVNKLHTVNSWAAEEFFNIQLRSINYPGSQKKTLVPEGATFAESLPYRAKHTMAKIMPPLFTDTATGHLNVIEDLDDRTPAQWLAAGLGAFEKVNRYVGISAYTTLPQHVKRDFMMNATQDELKELGQGMTRGFISGELAQKVADLSSRNKYLHSKSAEAFEIEMRKAVKAKAAGNTDALHAHLIAANEIRQQGHIFSNPRNFMQKLTAYGIEGSDLPR